MTIAEALEKLGGISRATFYKTIQQSERPIKRWRQPGDRRILFDMRQLRPLFKPRPVKG